MQIENESNALAVEAALKYLIRSYEILNSFYGVKHPSVSAASLAVASVFSAVNRLTETREWLGSTIHLMEGLNPSPDRAIAFARQQLANVLVKQNYQREAIDVLHLTTQFYRTTVHNGIRKFDGNMTQKTLHFLYNKQLSRDLHIYFALTEKIVGLYKNFNQMNLSLEHTLSMIDLSDIALGWDSPEFGMKDCMI